MTNFTQNGTLADSFAEPISITDVEGQVLFDLTDQRAAIDIFITAIRERAEAITRRALVVKNLVLTLDSFPSGSSPIEIPNPPLLSVTSVVYIDSTGASIVLIPSAYRVIPNTTDPVQPSQIVPVYGSIWPTTINDFGSVQIFYACGYGIYSGVSLECPKAIKQWMLINVGTLCENREATVIAKRGETLIDLSTTVADGLIANYRVAKW